jgi:subtilisin family serine protease
MQFVTRCTWTLVLMLALCARMAQAQIRLPQLPLNLPAQALQNTAQLVDQTSSRTLEGVSNLRRIEIARLVRASPLVELDRDGQPVVRSEILALSPSAAGMEAALAGGFTVIREQTLDALGLHVVVLATPHGLRTGKALRQLRDADPAGTYDYNHIYLGSGAARGQATPGAIAPQTLSANPAIGASTMRVGLIDTGVDTTHPAFAAASIHQWGCADRYVPAAHGTAVASILVGNSDLYHGVQPAAELYSADIYCGSATGGAVDALLAAFGWLVKERVAVINVSLVGPKNAMLQAVIARLVDAGFVIVAAVGNDGPAAPPLYPASYPNVIGVTAVDAHHKVLIEAARGPQVMFAAIGSDTAAAGIKHDYTAVRGTSFAAPIVAGLLAAELSSPDAGKVPAVLEALEGRAVDLGAAGKDLTYGFGLLGAEFRVDPASLPH